MTVAAVDMESGKFYRLTRDCWTGVYYMRCPDATRRQLEKRLSVRNPQTMTPDDYRTWTTLLRCREGAHVLGVRFLRYRDESGGKHESREYVAFPLDYPLREVAKPPSYGAGKRQEGKGSPPGERAEAEEGATPNGEEEADESGATGGAGSQGAGRRDSEDHRSHV